MRSRKHGQRSHEELLWISNVFERIHFSSPNIVKIHNGRFTKAADISGISGSSMALSCSGLETRVTILFTISPHILEAAGLRRAGVSHMSLVAATAVNFTSIVRMISLSIIRVIDHEKLTEHMAVAISDTILSLYGLTANCRIKEPAGSLTRTGSSKSCGRDIFSIHLSGIFSDINLKRIRKNKKNFQYIYKP
ncbi:hypothetical protein YC2023_002086 [Brassica napus]